VSAKPFICGEQYTIADMSLYAYASRAEEAGLSVEALGSFRRWLSRVEAQPGFLGKVYPYSLDPNSSGEL
jgi:glutathione S-transferase